MADCFSKGDTEACASLLEQQNPPEGFNPDYSQEVGQLYRSNCEVQKNWKACYRSGLMAAPLSLLEVDEQFIKIPPKDFRFLYRDSKFAVAKNYFLMANKLNPKAIAPLRALLWIEFISKNEISNKFSNLLSKLCLETKDTEICFIRDRFREIEAGNKIIIEKILPDKIIYRWDLQSISKYTKPYWKNLSASSENYSLELKNELNYLEYFKAFEQENYFSFKKISLILLSLLCLIALWIFFYKRKRVQDPENIQQILKKRLNK